MRVVSFEEPIRMVLNRIEDRLLAFLRNLPDSGSEIERFVKELQEFYKQEIKKLKLWVLSEVHDSIKKEIESYSVDFQNKFFEERIKQKIEDDTSIDYQPELVELTPSKPVIQKIYPGAAIGCCSALIGLLIAGSGVGLSKALAILLIASAGGGAISNCYFKEKEEIELNKVLKKYLEEEKEQLSDFSKNIIWKYEQHFEKFKEFHVKLN